MRNRKIQRNICSLLAIGLIAGGLAGAPRVVSGEPGQEYQCLDCHDDTWNEGVGKNVVHEPFQEQKCQSCHVDSPFQSEKQQSSEERSQVTWISRNFTPGENHWLRFVAPEDNGEIFLEAENEKGKSLQLKMALPPFDDLPRYDNDGAEPRISNVEVLEVKKGLVLSAVIGWDTDEVANSLVHYGLDKLNMSSPVDNSFTTSHQVTLSGFDAKKSYQFEVVSEDLFGNLATSEVFTLQTDKTFSLIGAGSGAAKTTDAVSLNTEVFRSDDRYLIKVTANQPVTVGLGSLPVTMKKTENSQSSTQAVKHVVTNSEFHLTLSICYSCHREYQAGRSHPVNVYPKKGIVIPPEYPTLADGRMTCMTCHTKHASDVPNRLLKASLKELCVGCHVGL